MPDIPPTGGQRMRRLMERTLAEATARGSATVEAEHLLLALSAEIDSPAREILDGAGLDTGALRDALAAERRRSLAAVGMSDELDATLASAPRFERPHWGNSVRAAVGADRRGDRDARGGGARSGRGGRRPGPDRDEDRVAAATEAWLAAAEAWSAAAEGDPADREAAKRAAAEARRAAMEARRTVAEGRRPAPDNRRRRADDLYVLVGILSAEYGTVPRALALVGVDRLELLRCARAARDDAYGRAERL